MCALLVGEALRMRPGNHQGKGCNSQAQKNSMAAGNQQGTSRHHCSKWASLTAPQSITAHFFPLENGVGAYVPDGQWKEL